MKIIFVSKENCPYCEKAKTLLEKLTKEVPDFNVEKYQYQVSEGALTKEQVTDLVNAKDVIKTLPQIALEKEGEVQHIGGYTELKAVFPHFA